MFSIVATVHAKLYWLTSAFIVLDRQNTPKAGIILKLLVFEVKEIDSNYAGIVCPLIVQLFLAREIS